MNQQPSELVRLALELCALKRQRDAGRGTVETDVRIAEIERRIQEMTR